MISTFIRKRIFDHKWLIKKIHDDVVKGHTQYFRGIIYDLGCGDKPYHALLEKHGTKYIGVDWDQTQHHNVMDVVADLNKPLEIKSEVADTIVSFQVMEHLMEPTVFLNEAYRILKYDGVILITVPFQHQIHEDPHDYYRYTKYGLNYLLLKSGFEDITIEPIKGYWVNAANKFSYQTTRWVKGPKLIKYFLIVFFGVIRSLFQWISLFLDKYDFNDRETSGYCATAKKKNT